VAKKKNQTNKQPQSQEAKRTGYGDKKLEGPNQPAE
jgi:hypothetical protein